MVKLICIISILLLTTVFGYDVESISTTLLENLDAKKIVINMLNDENSKVSISSDCFDTLQEYINHYQSYADKIASMILFSGRDLNDLGRYINCNSLNYTRYISASVNGLPIGIYFGICGPIECTQEDYYPLKKQLVATAKFISDSLPDVATLKVDWTEDNFSFVDSKAKNAENTKITAGFIVTVSFFSFFLLFCILGTIFELRLESLKRKAAVSEEEYNYDYSVNRLSEGSRSSIKAVDIKPRGAFQNFLYSFALFNNTRRLIYGRGEHPDKELEILNGIRVFAITFVIIGHTYLYSLRGPVSNPTEFLTWIDDIWFTIMLSAPYVVDIFFWLSGFLGAYLMLELMKKKNGRNQPYYFIILHRFLRIVPLYFATILFFWFIMSMAGNGPVFYRYKDDYAGACDKYWWSHLIFFNNFYPFHSDEQCMGWSWYLPNDMQFFLILPILVWFLYHYRKIGVALIWFIMLSSFGVTFAILYSESYSPSFLAIREDYYRVYYMKPYTRIAPFLQGVYLGFILYCFRNDESETSFRKRFCETIKNSWILRQICYWFGAAIMIVITFTFYNINNRPEDYSRIFNAAYMTLIRAAFVFGLILFIFPILLGRGQVLRSIMGHDWMTPLARISFGMYLVHPTYMLFESFNRQRATWTSHNANILTAVGWWFVTVITSFLFTIVIETPCANLEKNFLMKGGSRKTKENKKAFDHLKINND